MDVNNLNANNPLDRRLREADSQQTRDSSGAAAGHRSADEAGQSRRDDEVHLSSQARQLRDIEHQVSEQEAFDQGRVEKIRAAIAEGRYHVDPERLAARFMELEYQLHQ
jgi:negative regulator of flagellin synthesis FlgM